MNGTSRAGNIGNELGCPRRCALAPKLKSAAPLPLAGTVTCIVFSVPAPGPSCQATTVYVPGGTPLIVKLPSSALTAKNGCLRTPTYAFIQGCWLHFTGTMASAVFSL